MGLGDAFELGSSRTLRVRRWRRAANSLGPLLLREPRGSHYNEPGAEYRDAAEEEDWVQVLGAVAELRQGRG